MIKLRILKFNDYGNCFDLLSSNLLEKQYFNQLGWTFKEFEKQFTNETNFSLGLFSNNIIEAFIVGNLIKIKNIFEYEILIIYVKEKKRKLGYASKLLTNIPNFLQNKTMKKIYLEVASNNYQAINLYKKNNFRQNGYRKNYYNIYEKKINAILFEKIIK